MNKSHFITGLDIGTNSIKVLVAVKNSGQEELEVVSQIEVKNSGVRKGVVVNVEETSENIRQAIDFARENLKGKISSVWVNIGGSHLNFIPIQGLVSVSRADQKISESDIERVLQASQTISLSSNQEILEAYPQEFIVDGQKGLKEVLGLQGLRLEVKALCLTAFSPYLKNLTEAVSGAGLEIEGIFPSVLASANSVLSEQEKEIGVALLEIGAGITNLAVFEEGNLIHGAVFALGSANITNDIAILLKTEIETAERIKKEFATCQPPKKEKKIQLLREEYPLVFSQKFLAKVVEARVKEIFGEANRELKKLEKFGKLPGGIVLTGGGAKLPKIIDLAKKEFMLSSRIGLPQGFSPAIEDPSWAVSTGLVLEAMKFFEEEKGLPLFEKGLFAKIRTIFANFIP